MSTSREEFIGRIELLKRASTVSALLDGPLENTDQNKISQILRSGLCVCCFAATEEFIRTRLQELTSNISASTTRFSDLPEKLQLASTKRAVEILNSKYLRQGASSDVREMVSIAQEHIQGLAGTQQSPLSLSVLTLDWKESNISSRIISELLKILNVTKPWDRIQEIAYRIGLGIPSIRESFGTFSDRRHIAAHRSDAQTTSSELTEFINIAIVLAVAFDSLATAASERLVGAEWKRLCPTTSKHVLFRFIDHRPEGYLVEHAEGKKGYRRYSSIGIALENSLPRARRNGAVLVIRSTELVPLQWRI